MFIQADFLVYHPFLLSARLASANLPLPAAVWHIAHRWHLQGSKSHLQVPAIPSSVVLLEERRTDDPDASSVTVYLSRSEMGDCSLTDPVLSGIRAKVEGLARDGYVGLSCSVVAEEEGDIRGDGFHVRAWSSPGADRVDLIDLGRDRGVDVSGHLVRGSLHMRSACVQNTECFWVSGLGRARVGSDLELLAVDVDGLDVHHPVGFGEGQLLVQVNVCQGPFVFGVIETTKGQLAAGDLTGWSVDSEERTGKQSGLIECPLESLVLVGFDGKAQDSVYLSLVTKSRVLLIAQEELVFAGRRTLYVYRVAHIGATGDDGPGVGNGAPARSEYDFLKYFTWFPREC